jgi:Txe/YoeB family toxin of toxin-antitoxin system
MQESAKKINIAGLKNNVQKLIDILHNNPYQNHPPYEKLAGDLLGSYSRRINIQHRLIYQVYDNEKIVKIIRMWTHYE